MPVSRRVKTGIVGTVFAGMLGVAGFGAYNVYTGLNGGGGGGGGGKPAVHWTAGVLHPDLKDGETIVTGPAEQPDVEVRDRNGVVMTGETYPSLARIFGDFRTRYAGKLHGGTPGIETYIQDPS